MSLEQVEGRDLLRITDSDGGRARELEDGTAAIDEIDPAYQRGGVRHTRAAVIAQLERPQAVSSGNRPAASKPTFRIGQNPLPERVRPG